MLFDRQFGLSAFEVARSVSDSCGRILACDKLTQEPGKPVADTDIDTELDPEAARAQGAVALKLLVIWRGEENAKRCLELASEFMGRCHGAGLLGVLEAVVRPPHNAGAGWDRETSILEAAHALERAKPDLYKCEVPFQGRGDEAPIRRTCERITESISCPWVVLSAGVALADFPRAVEIACRAGASGFLAGRAIWSDTVAGTNYRAALAAVAVPRLLRLADIVDSVARPWYALSAGPKASVD
jgi:sulfofructosephosphate aldolase